MPLPRLIACSLAAAPLALGGCSKTIALELTVVEPCDQQAQALNGVSSFVVSTSGSSADDSVAFKSGDAPPVGVGLGDTVFVTVQAFADDVSEQGAAGATPQAVGRTLPFAVTETTPDVKSTVVVGKLDSFGRTTRADGECSDLTPGAPVVGRHGHTATFVPVLNQVLIFGGAVWVDGEERLLASADLWDPATGDITALEGVDVARAYHAATAMPDGRVFISGGFGVVEGTLTTLQSGLIFDPITRDLTTILLRQARAHHTSTLMEGAKLVALVGGCSGTGPAQGCTPSGASGTSTTSPNLVINTETFDVETGRGTVQVVNGLLTPRAFHQSTSLENGPNTLLLVTGGANANGTVCDVEVFRADGGVLNNITATISLAGFPADACPARHATVSLGDGQGAAIIGGQVQAPGGSPEGPGTAAVFFFSTTGGIEQVPSAQLFNSVGRAGALAARMQDGSIVIVGGTAGAGAPAEVLARQGGSGVFVSRLLANPPGVNLARDRAALAVLPTNQLLFTGGHSTTPPFVSSTQADLYFGP